MENEERSDRGGSDDPLEKATGEIPPVSPGRRRAAMLTGFLFIAVILGFLIWFFASNTERADEPPRLLGSTLQSEIADVSTPTNFWKAADSCAS